jgi:hypothetical protein
MSNVKYELRVKGLSVPDGTIPVRALLDLLQGLIDTAERGLRLAVEGESVKRGKAPTWIGAAIDLNFTGLKTGSTVLGIEAPTFRDTIGGRLDNQEHNFFQVAPEDTALSLVSRSIRDATHENRESDYFDAGVLNGLLQLSPFFKNYARSLELTVEGNPRPEFVLRADDMEKVERLKKQTPEPQAFVVTGMLDEIEHTNRRFQVRLSDDRSIPGRVDEEFMTVEDLRDFWGKRVTVKGMVYFKPSGKVQLLESHFVRAAEPGEEIFDELPIADSAPELFDTSHFKAGYVSPFKEVRGSWPGDEPLETILEALRASS